MASLVSQRQARRQFLILLVPIINFVFLALFILSPSSLPRLPRSSSLSSRALTAILYDESELPEHFDFRNMHSPNERRPVASPSQYGGSIADNTVGYDPYSGSEAGSASDNDPLSLSFNMEQRKLVEGVKLTPLPDHLITTYRPGYYDPPPHPISPYDQAAAPLEQETDKTHGQDRDIDLDPSTKYLTFLPHSGFHNQLMELENALLLARLLNRTLIMPKVYLGPPMPWLTFQILHSRLLYQTKIGLEHCQAIIENQEEEEVIEYEEELEQQPEQAKPRLLPPPSSLQQPSASEEQAELQLQQNKKQSSSQQQQQQHHHHHQQPSEDMRFQDTGFIQKDYDQVPEFVSTEELGSNPSEKVDIIPENYQESTEISPEVNGAENDADEDEGPIPGQGPILHENYEGDEEEEETSLTEEPEDDDGDRVRVATGDVAGEMLYLEDTEADDEYYSGDDSETDGMNWERIKDEEEDKEFDTEYNEYDTEYDTEYDMEGLRMGIIEGLDEDGRDWYPDSVVGSDQDGLYDNSERFLSQQMDDEASLPLFMPPLDSNIQEDHPRIRKRSTANNRPVRRNGPGRRQLPDTLQPDAAYPQQHPHLQPTERPQQPHLQRTVRKQRRVKWSPLPAECLQYESWTMTDWDTLVDLNPLRRYVRVLTRESMSMAYLANRFNLTFPREEEPKLNETATELVSESSDGSVAKEEESDRGSENVEGEGNEGEEDEEQETPLLRSEGDVLIFDDTRLYNYRFTENVASNDSLRSKFRDEFTIEWLADRPERLIHLGSIFGTGRINIDSLESKAWLQMIRDHLILGTDILQTTSQRIADKISCSSVQQPLHSQQHDNDAYPAQQTYYDQQSFPSSIMETGFVGVHIRMSDGHFSLTARETIENIRQELMWQIGITEDDGDNGEDEGDESSPRFSSNAGQAQKRQGRLSVEQCRSRALNHRRALQEQLSQQPHEQGQQHAFLHMPYPNTTPPKRRSNGRFTPIYLATDAQRPRADPVFDKLFETFNCIFTLHDFEDDLELLHQFRNPEDGALMAKFLIPMVDAMVVAKSAAFFGTHGSTFSHYIQKQLRPAYTGLYD